MRFNLWFKRLLLVCLLYLTGEILFRRFFWRQIPTQVSPTTVYLTLAASALLAVFLAQAPEKIPR